ncbi:electron transfer flavoprotein subunit alpha/FixB family protein [Lipingzhangella sp. LS1_29]|uniref:Electron transfer flavoprotein subunit alpha/FixB family protein n=1 Tax=Lipingzhangella rawalii TaxID=2055835 RepID=A0ABU2H3A4_9ACTN|nr:electron transfer flavoprotein subunit alpha/FixB family protein [Lipingzhangella rawalii]MDS1269782.1 electron transfer flavoprotein subunit alpha/FixB family protein [Lipingzhangella rawalii]
MLLTLVETTDGSIAAGSGAALAHTRELAEALGAAVGAVAFTSAPGLGEDLAAYGVSQLYVIEHAECAEYAPERWGEALAQLLRDSQPGGVIAAATDRGNEVMAHAAARSGLPLATNCLTVSIGDSAASAPWSLTRQRGGGVLLEDAELTAPIKLVTVLSGAAGAAEQPAAEASSGVEVHTVTPRFDDEPEPSRIVDRTAGTTGVTLATAPVVVSGGRGLGSAEAFGMLDELAELLGGAVGCSRVATNDGWRPHSDQVGLTGTKIAPELYIACGISGATQHWVGCRDARRILAINTDPQAPIMTRATYAVIGDVHEVVPAIIAEIRRRRAG